MPWPLQALGGEIIIPGSVILSTAGTHNVVVPKYRFLRARLYGSSGGAAGLTFLSNGTVSYQTAGNGGTTSFNGVQVTGGNGSVNTNGGSGGAIASGGDVIANGTEGANGGITTTTSVASSSARPVPAGPDAINGGAGAAALASARADNAAAQGVAPGGGPRGERQIGSRSYEQNKNNYTDYYCGVTGGGQAGGYAEKTWQRGQAGAPSFEAVLAAIVGAAGPAGANGGAAGQPGQIILDWW